MSEFTTGEELSLRWAMRDAQYAESETPMTPAQESLVRETRKWEANMLPDLGERSRAFNEARMWEPPEAGEFTLKDWLE